MRNLKRVLSLALALVMVLGMMVIGTSAATYTDDAEIEYKEAVEVMTGIGLFEGNPDGTLAPKQVLNRAMAATILARVMLGNKVDTLKATQQIFSDVAVTDWYAPAVQYCYNTGLIDGNGDGTFNPKGELTGIAFAKLLLVALGYDADAQGYVGKDWAANIAVDALAKDLYIKGVDIAAKLTREQAAQMLLQVMDEFTVVNSKIFDKSTGTYVLVLGGDTTTTFMAKYYKGLALAGAGHEATWGRPYDYQWTYTVNDRTNTLWTEWEAPVATYTTAKTHCEVAADYGMNYYVDHYEDFVTFTNGYGNKGSEHIVATNTVNTIGAQGRLTEVYSETIVYIDTFLAYVKEVTPVKYDAAGHKAVEASRTIVYYAQDALGNAQTYTVKETNKFDYAEKAGQWLLININTKAANNDEILMVNNKYAKVLKIVGEPKTVVGAQTILWGNEAMHTVAGNTYVDSCEYALDAAANTANKQFTWFFDNYGNLIGSNNIAPTPDSYATIADIQWYNPASVNGYAWATLVYADGTTEQVMVSHVNGNKLSYTWFEGDYAKGYVSMNYGYNSQYVGNALFAVSKGSNGVVTLTEVSGKATNVTITKGNPIMLAGALGGYLDDNTQFLVRTGVPGKFVYSPVTGYNQIASLTNATVYYVNLDADYAAEIVYVYGAPATSSSSSLYYVSNLSYSWVAGTTDYITAQGTMVNGVVTPVTLNKDWLDGQNTELEKGEMYYAVDKNGDGKVNTSGGDTFAKIGATPVAIGGGKYAVKLSSYTVLNNALQVPGVTVPYNITNPAVYGNWVGAGDIVIVYTGDVTTGAFVSAIYVL